jgi:hypothetical protein
MKVMKLRILLLPEIRACSGNPLPWIRVSVSHVICLTVTDY